MKIKNVDLTGSGVAARLHKPVLDEFSHINTTFVRLPEEQEIDFPAQSSDLIIIGTPTYKHIQHLLYAIKYYPFILCEKPVGYSLKQILTLKKEICKTNSVCFVNYQLRFLPVISDIISFANNNSIKSLSILYRSNARVGNQFPQWYLDYRVGGGILYSILPHIIDLINFLGFGIKENFKFDYNKKIFEVPMDEITIHGITSSGVSIEIAIDTKKDFDQFTVELLSDNKVKRFDFIGNCEVSNKSFQYTNGALSSKNVSPWRMGFRMLMSELLNLTNVSCIATIEDAIKVHYVLNNIVANSAFRAPSYGCDI